MDKSALVHKLASDIRAAYYGSIVFSPKVFDTHKQNGEQPTPKDFGLTAREMEILALTGQGIKITEVAHKLGVTEATVRFHMFNVRKKFGVSSYKQALVIAARNRLV